MSVALDTDRRKLRHAAWNAALYRLRARYPNVFDSAFEVERALRPDIRYQHVYMNALNRLRRRYPGVFRRYYDEELAERGIELTR